MATPSSKLKRKLDESVACEGQGKKIRVTERKCDLNFYDIPCEDLAKKLLGCILVSHYKDETHSKSTESMGSEHEATRKCWGRIVETEAYLGGEDKAAHSYGGRRTERNEAMYMPPGTAYVYSIYGMHSCFNISSRGDGAAVLVRALEPLGGLDHMRTCRNNPKNDRNLCNGPAKLCQATGIDKTCNKLNMTSSDRLWVEPYEEEEGFEVVERARIGIDYAGEEWAKKLLRFYIKDSRYVSKK